MNIIHFQDPSEFRSTVKDLLLHHEAENNLPFGILASIISGEYIEKTPYMGLVEEDGSPFLVMMCTPPFPVLFTYMEIPPSRQILSYVLADLSEKLGEDFTGISANKTLSAKLVSVWEENTGEQADIKMAMRIYKLDHVIPVENVSGNIRSIIDDDRELLLDWYTNFHLDGLGEEPDPAQVEKKIGRYLSSDPTLRGLMIWEKDGKPVSMSGYAGPTPNGIRIGAVYTPRKFRRQGYASACTAGLSQHLLDMGFQFCFLFTDLLNPTSNHIYQQIGFKPVCDVDRYDFNK